MFQLPQPPITALYSVKFPEYESVYDLPLDDGKYNQPKISQLPVGAIISRRQFHFNIVGYAHYASGALSFNYCYGSSRDILGLKQDTQLPKEILAAIRDTFGFIIYDYKLVLPQAIHHYPSEETAAREYFCMVEFMKHYNDRENAGYTLEFLYYSSIEVFEKAIEAAIKNDVAGVIDKYFYVDPVNNYRVYRLKDFINYRELALRKPQQALRLHQIKIDTENKYNVKNFCDLYFYLKTNPIVKATGASGSAIQVPHLTIESFKELFLGKFADSQIIPGDEIIRVLSRMPAPIAPVAGSRRSSLSVLSGCIIS